MAYAYAPVTLEKKFSDQAFAILNDLRKAGQLCDANIIVDGLQFPVHKAIMASCSNFFRALFTNSMRETRQKEVTLQGVSSGSMSLIIDYAYTRYCELTADNVQELLIAANYFVMNGLQAECSNFLLAQLDDYNCIGIRNFARTYFATKLERAAHWHIIEHFQTVVKEDPIFESLTAAEVEEIIDDDALNVTNEQYVFEAVVSWVNGDPANRVKDVPSMLRICRLALIDRTYYTEVVQTHPYVVMQDAETLHVVADAGRQMQDTQSESLVRPRFPYELLFSVGGWSGGSPTNVVEVYNFKSNHWLEVTCHDGTPRAYHGCVCLDGLLYIIGGFDGMEYFNSVRRFNPHSKTWTEVAPMYYRRCYVSVAVLDGCLYAMGGFDGHTRHNTAERYTPSDNQWCQLPPMRFQRSDAKATALNGKIFIAGGFNGQECLSSAEVYDPETNQWTLLPPMADRRSGVGVAAYQGRLYAIGGFNGVTRLNSAERFNPANSTWHSLAHMIMQRSNFAIEVLDNKLLVIGGYNGVSTIPNVEYFDGIGEEWHPVSDMNVTRSALSACVLRGLSNVRQYIEQVNRDVLQQITETSEAAPALETAV